MLEELALTDPKRWENAEFDWDLKQYYAVSFSCLFGKPKKLFEAVQQLKAEIATREHVIPDEAPLLIEIGKFKGRLLIEIEKPREYDASVIEIEKSKVYTAVHEGPFKTIGDTTKKLKQKVIDKKGLTPSSIYYWDFRHGPDLAGQRADRFIVFCRV